MPNRPKKPLFERVQLHLRKKPMLLQVIGESKTFLRGYEVNKEGDEITGKGFDRRLHIIEKTSIKSRIPLYINLTYGLLEEWTLTSKGDCD